MRTQLISNSTPDGKTPQTKHKPVLLQEVLDNLQIKKSDVVFDGTVGSGGHASAMLSLLGDKGFFFGTDLDENSLLRTRDKLESLDAIVPWKLFEGNFADMERFAAELELKSVDKILLDLGWSQDQFDNSGRGFSFRKDEPLLMSYASHPDDESALSAYEIVNSWQEDTLIDILQGFGEERFAKRIAAAIVAARSKKDIQSSKELADIVSAAVPGRFRYGRLHPATKTFQAIRIAVNQELSVLQDALSAVDRLLSSGGRVAVISFHSLEDRIVKRQFRQWAKEGKGRMINKKPITASKKELQENRRARSAKLRVYEKSDKTEKEN